MVVGSARLGSARLGSARLGSARLGSARPEPSRATLHRSIYASDSGTSVAKQGAHAHRRVGQPPAVDRNPAVDHPAGGSYCCGVVD